MNQSDDARNQRVFELDHSRLARDQRFAGLAETLTSLSPIDSEASFNRYCRTACQVWPFHEVAHDQTSAEFAALSARVEQGGEGVIQTAWGGVVITRHVHPQVEKYLVIRKAGYLALEMHEKKDEYLDVRQGAGMVLWRAISDQPLVVDVLQRGATLHFAPGIEHCLIGTEDLLVFERSVDPKGMDRDLIFIYEPELGSQESMIGRPGRS